MIVVIFNELYYNNRKCLKVTSIIYKNKNKYVK